LDMVESEADLYRILSAITTSHQLAPIRTFCMHCKRSIKSSSQSSKSKTALHCVYEMLQGMLTERIFCQECEYASGIFHGMGLCGMRKDIDVEEGSDEQWHTANHHYYRVIWE
jgi:hypothetical protein